MINQQKLKSQFGPKPDEYEFRKEAEIFKMRSGDEFDVSTISKDEELIDKVLKFEKQEIDLSLAQNK